MLVGYARVSTAEQNPDHQTDALLRVGVARGDIHVDHASGAKASRPKLDLVLRLLRDGDVLVVTRLDRLGRSVLHLVTLGAQLRDREVGLKVVEQGIDTATAEGRAMFGVLSVLAELQRELIVANTRDGLAAARARGRRRGRPPRLTPDQATLAQRLCDAGSTPSPRSPGCSVFPAAPSTATSTKPPPRQTLSMPVSSATERTFSSTPSWCCSGSSNPPPTRNSAPEYATRPRVALAALHERVSRLDQQGQLRIMDIPTAATAFHALREGLGALETRGLLPQDHAEQLWRTSLAALVTGL